MKVYCAWCDKLLRDDGSGEPGNTHGICKKCLAKQLRELDKIEKRKGKRDDR